MPRSSTSGPLHGCNDVRLRARGAERRGSGRWEDGWAAGPVGATQRASPELRCGRTTRRGARELTTTGETTWSCGEGESPPNATWYRSKFALQAEKSKIGGIGEHWVTASFWLVPSPDTECPCPVFGRWASGST